MACSPATPPQQQTFEPVSIFSAQSIGPIESGVQALALAPNATIPWEGRLLIAPKSGGLVAYSVEGKMGNRLQGAVYTSLAAHPGFELRKLKTTFFMAVSETGQIDAFIIDDARGQIFEIPLEGLHNQGVLGVCALDSLPGTPKFALSRKDGSFEQWQISDTGADVLQAKSIISGKLSIPTHGCSAAGGNVFAHGAKGGIFAIDVSGSPTIANGQDTPLGNWIAISADENQIYLLRTQADAGILAKYSQQLTRTGSLSAVKSLSLPPVTAPGAMAVSNWSFGGAGFSAGLLAIADDENQKISLVVLDTLPGFAKHQEAK